MDQFVETTSESWGSRLLDSLKSVLIGLLLFAVSFPLLWWNEGRAVQTAKSLDEGAGQVAAVQSNAVDPGNDGKLVHVSATAKTDDVLADADFGVEQKGIKLVRTVEMYQWVEDQEKKKKKKVGGKEETTTKYSYVRKWSDSWHDSDEFRKPEDHENPQMRYRSATRIAQNVRLGAFTIPSSKVRDIEGESPLPPSAKAVSKMTPTLKEKTKVVDDAFYLRLGAEDADFDTGKPELGDYRVRFSLLEAQDVSIVAKQKGSSFEDFQTEAGDKLFLLETGRHSADKMFSAAEEANASLTWGLRGLGFFLMALGIFLIFRPLTVLADVIPLFGEMLRIGALFVGVAIAAPLSLLTISIAWISARPFIGIALLVAVAAMIGGVVTLILKRKKARVAA